MESLGTIKRGDTFSFTAAFTDASTGAVLTGAAASLKCDARNYLTDTLIDDLTVTETVVAGTYLFTAGSTALWVPGARLYLDIEYTNGGIISSTETFYIDVEADITHA